MLNTPGDFSPRSDARGLEQLLRKAFKQRVPQMPFVVFLDVNLPPSPAIPDFDKPWVNDLKGVLTLLGMPSPENPEPYSAIVATNFAYHFGSATASRPESEAAFVLPRFTDVPLNESVLNLLSATVLRYGRIPTQL